MKIIILIIGKNQQNLKLAQVITVAMMMDLINLDIQHYYWIIQKEYLNYENIDSIFIDK